MSSRPVRPFETELTFQVMSYDVDYVGYAHNTVYIRWLEDLRVAMLAPHFSLERCVKEGITPIILKTCVEYKKPLRLFDTFVGKVWVSRMEGLRWMVTHEFVHQNTIVATAEQHGIFINLRSHRPVSIPEELSRKFLAYHEETKPD